MVIKAGTRTVTTWEAPTLACCTGMAGLLTAGKFRHSNDSGALVMYYSADGRPGAYCTRIDYCPCCGQRVVLA